MASCFVWRADNSGFLWRMDESVRSSADRNIQVFGLVWFVRLFADSAGVVLYELADCFVRRVHDALVLKD